MHYRPALLKPMRAEGARAHNEPLLGPATMGIEVTEPELAAQCGLGNLDPQHSGGDPALAAITAAIDLALPPDGSRLVTIRPDADAYGAMAVLELRRAAIALSPRTRARVDLIAAADTFSNGPWPGERPLPLAATEIDEVGPGINGVGALAAGLLTRVLAPDEAVRIVREWLLEGVLPAGWLAAALDATATLVDALSAGRVAVSRSPDGFVAIVRGTAPGALRLGYRFAPVVLADETLPGGAPAPLRKVSVAQYVPGYADLTLLARLLSRFEPGWGGSPTLIGSPQGTGTALACDFIGGMLLTTISSDRKRRQC